MNKVIYCNCEVVTMDEKLPKAEAVLTEDGIIKKVGTSSEILKYKDDNTDIRDLEGKTLMPGFIDPHSHLSAAAYNFLLVNAKPSPSGNCDSIDALIDEFKKALKQDPPGKDEWLMGMGYDNSAFKDGKHPTKLDLDKVSTEIPISCVHASGHCAVFNSKALELLGYVGDFEVPEGGTVERFPNGDTNGLVTETAFISPEVQSKMKTPPFEKIVAAIKETCEYYSSFGITTAQDARVSMSEYQLLSNAAKMGSLSIDVVGFAAPDAAEKYLPKDGRGLSTEYENRFRFGGYKIFLDGSPQAKTAWLSKPYKEAPEGKSDDYSGFPAQKDEYVVDVCKLCIKNKWQLNVHCNGDAASEQLINCYGQALKETKDTADLRPVMIHAQTVRDDQLDRMKDIGMIVSFFLDHIYYWGDYHYESVLGEERASRISPARSAADRGINYTMHQDTPVVKPDSLFAVHNAVNRTTKNGRVLGEEQKLSVMEALKGITINGAYQIFEEDKKGSITEGKNADLVILAENPLTVDKKHIKDIKVLETIKNGKTIYKAE